MTNQTGNQQATVARGAIIVLAGLIFARLVNYSYQILLTRTDGQAEFGLFFMYDGVFALCCDGDYGMVVKILFTRDFNFFLS